MHVLLKFVLLFPLFYGEFMFSVCMCALARSLGEHECWFSLRRRWTPASSSVALEDGQALVVYVVETSFCREIQQKLGACVLFVHQGVFFL